MCHCQAPPTCASCEAYCWILIRVGQLGLPARKAAALATLIVFTRRSSAGQRMACIAGASCGIASTCSSGGRGVERAASRASKGKGSHECKQGAAQAVNQGEHRQQCGACMAVVVQHWRWQLGGHCVDSVEKLVGRTVAGPTASACWLPKTGLSGWRAGWLARWVAGCPAHLCQAQHPWSAFCELGVHQQLRCVDQSVLAAATCAA